MVQQKLEGFSRDVFVYGIGDGLGRMIGLVMLPILSRIFGPAEYGAIDLLSVGYLFLLMLCQLSVNSGVQRYYYRHEGLERRRMVTSCLIYLVAINVVVAAVVFASAPWLAGFLDGPREVTLYAIRILAIALVVEQTWSYLVLLLRLNRRAVTFSAMHIALVVLTPSATVFFVVGRDAGIPGVFQAKLLALVLVTLALFVVDRREFTPSADFGVFRRVFLFAIPGHPGLMVSSVMNVVPRYLLAAFAPLAEVGLMGIALRLASVMRVAMEAFNRAWNPFAYRNEGAPDERRIYEVVFRGALTGVLVVASGLSLFSPEALVILTPEEFRSAWRLAPFVIFSLGLDGLVRLFSTILYTRGRVVWSTYLGVVRFVLFLALGFALVPRHGAMGLAIALALTSVAFASAYAIVARRVFPFDLHPRRVAVAVGVAAVLVTLGLQIETTLGMRIAAKTAILLGIGFGAGAVLLEPTERRKLKSLVSRSA